MAKKSPSKKAQQRSGPTASAQRTDRVPSPTRDDIERMISEVGHVGVSSVIAGLALHAGMAPQDIRAKHLNMDSFLKFAAGIRRDSPDWFAQLMETRMPDELIHLHDPDTNPEEADRSGIERAAALWDAQPYYVLGDDAWDRIKVLLDAGSQGEWSYLTRCFHTCEERESLCDCHKRLNVAHAEWGIARVVNGEQKRVWRMSAYRARGSSQ